jgi:choline dehydrogenase-like flavoprotein
VTEVVDFVVVGGGSPGCITCSMIGEKASDLLRTRD